MKVLFWLIGVMLSGIIAVIPESVMYLTYHMIQPQTEVAKVIMFLGFWAFGGGLCVFFAFLGFLLFTVVTTTVLEA